MSASLLRRPRGAVTGFVVFFLIRSFIGVADSVLIGSNPISSQFEVAALAVIGMPSNSPTSIKKVPKAMMYGLTVGAVSRYGDRADKYFCG